MLRDLSLLFAVRIIGNPEIRTAREYPALPSSVAPFFLRGLSQYGDLHFAQRSGFWSDIHLCPHRSHWHSNRLTVTVLITIHLSAHHSIYVSSPANPINVVDSQGRPRAGASVTICTSAGAGIPCSPLASIFTDAGLTIAAANPQTTDGLGNLPTIYAAPGTYKYTVTGTGITPSGPFTATVSLVNGSAATHSSVTSASANPAQSGVLRLASSDAIEWRNNANSNDVGLTKTAAIF